MDSLPHGIKTIVVECKKETVTLKTSDHQLITWPKSFLKEETNVGDEIHLIAFSEKDAIEERKHLAKELLNEILRPN